MRRGKLRVAIFAGLLGLLMPLALHAEESLFLAATVDGGYRFVRPRLSVGWGVPFAEWLGVDVNPFLSGNALGGYVGVRFASPYVNVRSGISRVYSLNRSFLPITDSYNRELAELRFDDDRARYWAFRSELTLRIPLFGGRLISETESIGIRGTPEDRYVFVQLAGVVSGGSWLLRERLSYSYPVESVSGLAVGVSGEVVVLPERRERVWRAGVRARWQLWDNLGLRLTALPTISGPDRIGLVGGEFELGVRWFWHSK